MTLTTEQVKQAKQICKENGLNPKLVNKDLGNGFWNETCGGNFEGYISYLLKGSAKFTGSISSEIFARSTRDYRNGQAGRSAM